MDKTKQLLRTTARKEAEAKTLRIYATQVSIGIRRLPPNESPEEIDSYNRRIQNHAKAGLKRSKNVDYENMDKGSREQLNFARTMMAITKNTYSKEQIEQVKAKVKQAERPLGMIDILDHFREKWLRSVAFCWVLLSFVGFRSVILGPVGFRFHELS